LPMRILPALVKFLFRLPEANMPPSDICFEKLIIQNKRVQSEIIVNSKI
jgi:hypothetical protein